MSKHLLRVFLVTFPFQGHVNQLLRLEKVVALNGNLLVTFSTSKSIGKKMKKDGVDVLDNPTRVGNCDSMIRIEFFHDECSEDISDERHIIDTYLSKLETYGKEAVTEIINHHAENGHPVSCIDNNPFCYVGL